MSKDQIIEGLREQLKDAEKDIKYYRDSTRWWMEYCKTQCKQHEAILGLPSEKLIGLCTYGEENNSTLTIAYKK